MVYKIVKMDRMEHLSVHCFLTRYFNQTSFKFSTEGRNKKKKRREDKL